MCVVPEEADARPDHRSTENSKFADHRHTLKLEIIRENDMAADVGQHRKSGGSNNRAADRQAVETVGQVHGIARACNHKHDKDDKRHECKPMKMWNLSHPLPNQIRPEPLQEGKHQLRGVTAVDFHSEQCNSYART